MGGPFRVIQTEPLALRVREIAPLSPNLKQIYLEAADGGPLPTSQPGAHLTLTLPRDKGAHHKSYSIVSGCEDRAAYALIVRRTAMSRGGSRYIHESLRVGQVLRGSAPNSQFPLQSRARKHLLIGGGVGITPLLSFLRELRGRGGPLELHQVVKDAEVPVFETLLAPFAGGDVHIHGGRAGFDPLSILERQPLGTHLYCCGPTALMEAFQQTALAAGWPRTAVHTESFAGASGAPFIVRLGRSGGEIAVGEHESMLEALENAGLPAPSLCRGGACGECATAVLDGAPDHRDHVLSDAERAEGRLVMPCVSRSKTPVLTLDL
jgi:ferredoxin-NADP reductase